MLRKQKHKSKYALAYFPVDQTVGHIQRKSVVKGKWEAKALITVNWPGNGDVEAIIIETMGKANQNNI